VGLAKLYPLTDQAIHDLKSIATPIFFNKGAVIVNIGDVVTGIHFMVKGLGRSYTYKGKTEITSWIIQEGEPFTNYRSYSFGLPSRECTEALESGLAFFLPRKKLIEVYEKHNCIACMIVILNERNFVKMDDHIFNILFRTAEERYQHFHNEYPTIFNRMKLKDIASYLNMSPESLSRIRNARTKAIA
jgi:CRP-like cAMP-binding protein